MAHDLSAAQAHEPVTRPPLSYPLQDHPRTRPAIRFAKHDGAFGWLRPAAGSFGVFPGPGQASQPCG
jgi:hypothetical protein